MDREHERLSLYVDHLAGWFDGFWGHYRFDHESAHSSLRLRPGFRWDEQYGGEAKLHVRAHLKLPALNDRLTVLLLGEHDDFAGAFDEPGINHDGDHTVGLQYNLHSRGHSRFDVVVGLKKGIREKFGAKYRFHRPLWGEHFLHFSEEVFWIGGRGFGSLTRMDIDQKLGEDAVLRWANKAEYSEASNGLEWEGQYAWLRRLNDQSAVRAFAFTIAQTDPQLFREAGLGMGYRARLSRDWLHYELEARYGWRQALPGGEREGTAQARFRIEFAFGSAKRIPRDFRL